MSTLAERIHNLCPTRTLDVSNYGEFCGHDDDGPAFCKWEGHAIAGEHEQERKELIAIADRVREEVAALTAKMSEGHAIGCRCVLGFSLNLPVVEVDPRCVEWRRK